GGGPLRSLIVRCRPGSGVRDVLPRISGRLCSAVPQFSWLLVGLGAERREAAIATWEDHGTGPRHSSLVVEPANVRVSDAETLVALAAAGTGDDALVHHRWHEILGRLVLSARFYRALERAVVTLGEGAEGRAPGEARRELALVCASRLLFLSFLQARGWLDRDADFLVRQLEAVLETGGRVHRRFLEPLFFGTLNTRLTRRAPAARRFGRVPFLNGGLFARTPLEKRYRNLVFRDQEVVALFDDVLTRYRFSPREERSEWSESAIDPEILGRAFESLMASRERRENGAFYTPHSLVGQATDSALDETLAAAGLASELRSRLLRGVELAAHETADARRVLSSLRVLDPACGSGAFLVHLLERLAGMLRLAGDRRPITDVRRAVLAQSIFGVDVNPMAVWLCELRLWLSVVLDLDTDDPAAVAPLPNLDRNVRTGDTLAGEAWGKGTGDPEVARLRIRYARSTGVRKAGFGRLLDRRERTAALAAMCARLEALTLERLALVSVARGKDLFGRRRGALAAERLRREQIRAQVRSIRRQVEFVAGRGGVPFSFSSHFADAGACGGFDLVIGNPPWVRLHRIPPEKREQMRAQFRVFRDAAWQRGAAAANAGAGFAAQVDLAALFAERSVQLVRVGGVVALLLPVKLWRSLAGGGFRRLLSAECSLRVLEDWSEAPATFDAAVYPALVVARRAPPDPDDELKATVHRRHLAISWKVEPSGLALDDSPGAPWVVLPPDARRAFARIAAAGTPLAESTLGQPALGVKCGCNEAFVVTLVEGEGAGEETCVVRTARGNVRIETALLRPLLRGEGVRQWSATFDQSSIIWTHELSGEPLRKLPPAAARWFGKWRAALARRSDVRSAQAWWSLFRIDGAAMDRPRVVWSDVSRGPRACVLPAGSPVVPLNSCYVLKCRDDVDAAAFLALFNSPLIAAWFEAIAEPARGSFRRYLGWTVARLPVPHDWARAREILAPVGCRGVEGTELSAEELLDATRSAYRISKRTASALLEWTWR
ncbi:MAG: Eco57I restriction-modification methylase domain-containing protein, partial [Gemmatimonadota bacterium]